MISDLYLQCQLIDISIAYVAAQQQTEKIDLTFAYCFCVVDEHIQRKNKENIRYFVLEGSNGMENLTDFISFLNIFRIFKWAQVKRKPMIGTFDSCNPTLFKIGNYQKWKWSETSRFSLILTFYCKAIYILIV